MGQITNNPRFIEGPPPPPEELMAGATPQELADECAAIIGGPGDMVITVAALMVLDAIRSPFITGDMDVSLSDIVVALYVIAAPADAARLMPSHVGMKQAGLAFERTAKTPEHLEVYLRHIGKLDGLMSAAIEWADHLEGFSPPAAVDAIGRAMKVAMSGWSTIPSGKDEGQKKTRG
jgi:hypothetical protein